MKLPRTKAQELVNILYGMGKYVVLENNIPDLIDHLQETLLGIVPENYLDVLLAFIEGEELTASQKQQKFHLMKFLETLVSEHPEIEPVFLNQVEYPQDKNWSLADIAEAVYGVKGDAKIYHRDIPVPKNGEYYTTDEVKAIILGLDS